ncbi:gamma-glutamyltransferase [Pseudohoeflea coraliihabitans]|uniref:Glutathione hydrolase proenzyme n=1 Tax=Pseudohoeflea coraliihabitans TaxID=2860393 RepID=A0ABS6WRE5_9HYPH|nr:gamma-glutamyltransferase [Pseudohoeflea sp. DP4N28-3]MBW3097620.1 gamma-glutamyltransferase [Pseudohoeflea sp. DP4N28-3]
MQLRYQAGRAALAVGLLVCGASITPAGAQQEADAIAPEQATTTGAFATASPRVSEALAAKARGVPVVARDWMIAAAHPLAVEAGADILQKGGSAADAMVAVQSVLGLVEPQSSGLGGGAFLVWYDAASGEVTTLDGRETAPAAATPTLFQDGQGTPLKFFDAVVGGRSVGVPGTPMLMHQAHQRWGRAPWAGLFDRAIELAENGFPASARLAAMIAGDAERLARNPATAAYFLPGGAPLQAGTLVKNAGYAETLRSLAVRGPEAFYSGSIATDIVTAVQSDANPGVLSMQDFAGYRVKQRPPVCVSYRIYEICGMGPPSSGGLTVGQIFKLIEPFNLAGRSPDDAETWRIFGDAARLAFADRGRYMADIDFVPMPLKGLLDPDYLATRAALLAGEKALETVAPGQPAFDHALLYADDDALELPSTSHISIVDQAGNALSMTTTIENAFGSRLMVRGFLLNNELTDFSFRSHRDGVPIANRVEPGKRPRSSMAPTIVLRDGRPVLVIGSPGGSAIIGYVAQAILNTLDWNMNVQQALARPHRNNRFGPFELEKDTAVVALQPQLEALGFTVALREMNSGLHAIRIGEDGLYGGADPRREGIALGE